MKHTQQKNARTHIVSIRSSFAAFLPGPPAQPVLDARSPGASMQNQLKFRCRFTLRCNINIRNYTHMTITGHNQVQSLNGAHASGHAAIAMRGGGSGPERSLRACKVYSDPIERLGRQQPVFRALRRLVVHRRAVSEPPSNKIDLYTKVLRTNSSTVVRKRRGGHSWRRVQKAGQQQCALPSRAGWQAQPNSTCVCRHLPACHIALHATRPPHTRGMRSG